MKYKVNDKIKIVRNTTWHSYNIGDECYIIRVYEGFYSTSKTKWEEHIVGWYIKDEDCTIVEFANTKSKFITIIDTLVILMFLWYTIAFLITNDIVYWLKWIVFFLLLIWWDVKDILRNNLKR